jgi:hypothetical protein
VENARYRTFENERITSERIGERPQRCLTDGPADKADLMTEDVKTGEPFLIARGGPFFTAQRRLGLVGRNGLRPLRRALVLVAITWGVPLLLTIAAGTAFGQLDGRPYLLDPGVWARSCLAVAMLVIAEGQIEARLKLCVDQFFTTPLLAPGSIDAANSVVSEALRRRDSSVAEVLCLLISIAASSLVFSNMSGQTMSSWALTITGASVTISAAAWWSIIVSNTMFWFLLTRAVWRHIIWGSLLARLASLDLRLVATHPDTHGGLGFVGAYPNAYVTFTIATSCVFAAMLARQILHEVVTVASFGVLMGVWLVVVYLFFGIPLALFAVTLSELKAKTLRAASRQATEFQRLVERDTLGRNISCDDLTPPGDVADPMKFYEAVGKLSPLIINRSTLLPVTVVALLPLLAVGATQLPFKSLLPVVKHLLML